MKNEIFNIAYPAIYAGTQKSEINFFEGAPDLIKLFNPTEENVQDKADSRRRFFVTDATVASLEVMKPFIHKFNDGICGKDCLLILGSGEPYKTIESVLKIVSEAVKAGFTRKDVFVGIGGGVICDTTAFAASIFKRGAAVQFVPTTLLAMVDASVGGKSGCDFDNCKNIIGTFFPAEKLYYFPEFISTLPENQYNSGLAEAFKTALLFDEEMYELFKNESERINKRDMEILEKIIFKCVRAKAAIVEKDFTEKGERAFLNLGHTFAHALESVAGLGAETHGAAVAWGIGRAVELSVKKEYCLEAFKKEIFSILEKYNWETTAVPAITKGGGFGERLLSLMHKDKKNTGSSVRLILQKGLKQTFIEEVSDSEILSVLK